VPASYGVVIPSSTPGSNSASGNAGSYQEDSNPDQSRPNNTTVTLEAGEANWTIDFAFTPQEPTAVTLLSFTARSEAGGVMVEWVTGSELDSWGFHLWRSATGERTDAERITDSLVMATGGFTFGADYSFFDSTAQPGVGYVYWLQEITIHGKLIEYGPITLDGGGGDAVTSNHRLFLPLLNLGSGQSSEQGVDSAPTEAPPTEAPPTEAPEVKSSQ
jgi:hypothetical protein